MKKYKIIILFIFSPFILASIAAIYNLAKYGQISRPELDGQNTSKIEKNVDGQSSDEKHKGEIQEVKDYDKAFWKERFLAYKETSASLDSIVVGMIGEIGESKKISQLAVKHFSQTYNLDYMVVYLYPDEYELSDTVNMYEDAKVTIDIEKNSDGDWIYSAWDEDNNKQYESGLLFD